MHHGLENSFSEGPLICLFMLLSKIKRILSELLLDTMNLLYLVMCRTLGGKVVDDMRDNRFLLSLLGSQILGVWWANIS
jgi:hypothetical protein